MKAKEFLGNLFWGLMDMSTPWVGNILVILLFLVPFFVVIAPLLLLAMCLFCGCKWPDD